MSEFEGLIRYVGGMIRAYFENGRVVLDFLNVVFEHLFLFFLVIALVITCFYLIVSIYGLFVRKSEVEKSFIERKAPTVTIHIPTYNELAALNCAKRCLDFNYPKEKYKIIIGDDSNKPEISAKIDEFARIHSNVLVTRRGKNTGYKAGNLNYMLKFTDSEIIVVFDSDFLPGPDFLKRIVTPFIYDKDLAGVQAQWRPYNTSQNLTTVLGTTIINVFHHVILPFVKKISGTVNFCGSAEAVRRDLLLKLGSWKEGAFTEDVEYTMRVFKAKKQVLYLDYLKCDCEVPYTVRDLCKQQMRWAYGNITAFKEHSWSIFKDREVNLGVKMTIITFACAYVMTMLILLLTITGFLSFITHPPGPINFVDFFTDLIKNIILSSGLIVASTIAIIISKINKLNIFKMLLISFTSGLIVTYSVNLGIIKALLNRPMEWFLLQKSGNNL